MGVGRPAGPWWRAFAPTGKWCPLTMVLSVGTLLPCRTDTVKLVEQTASWLLSVHTRSSRGGPSSSVGRRLASQNPVLRLGRDGSRGERQMVARGVPWPPVGGYPQESSDVLGWQRPSGLLLGSLSR